MAWLQKLGLKLASHSPTRLTTPTKLVKQRKFATQWCSEEVDLCSMAWSENKKTNLSKKNQEKKRKVRHKWEKDSKSEKAFLKLKVWR